MEYIKQLKSAIQDIRHYPILSKYQKIALFSKCPHCEIGYLHAVTGLDTTEGEHIEDYLWCNWCDLSMDSSGGYTC